MTHSRRKSLKFLAAFSLFSSGVLVSESEGKTHAPSNPIRRPKISLNLFSFNQWLQDGTIQLDEVVRYCAGEGYLAIDPTAYYFPGYPDVPDDRYLFDFKRAVFENGLEISGSGIRNNFSDPDPIHRQQDLQLIEKWLVASQKMGIPVLRIFAGGAITDPEDKKKALGWMMEDFKRCADLGENYGVIIALQNHNEFIKTADEIIEIIDKVNSTWFKLHLDIGSFTEKNVYEEIEKVISFAVNWQVKELVTLDGNRMEPDYIRILKIIKAAEYEGYLPLETLGSGNPKEKLVILKRKVMNAIDQVYQ
jgi:sugar phosphate isomerase/epimerase